MARTPITSCVASLRGAPKAAAESLVGAVGDPAPLLKPPTLAGPEMLPPC